MIKIKLRDAERHLTEMIEESGAGQKVVEQAEHELEVCTETAVGNARRSHERRTAVSRMAGEEPGCFAAQGFEQGVKN